MVALCLYVAGSYALQDSVLPADSTVAAKLREHGLIILGKASLTEWSMFRADNSSHGWNAVFGQTYGAYYPKQCPGGSSGGSAVASDLGLAWATLGTEVGHIKTFALRDMDTRPPSSFFWQENAALTYNLDVW